MIDLKAAWFSTVVLCVALASFARCSNTTHSISVCAILPMHEEEETALAFAQAISDVRLGEDGILGRSQVDGLLDGTSERIVHRCAMRPARGIVHHCIT